MSGQHYGSKSKTLTRKWFRALFKMKNQISVKLAYILKQ